MTTDASEPTLQPSSPEPVLSAHGWNLIRRPFVKALLLWWGFPYVFQVVFLLGYVGFAGFGWFLSVPEGTPDKLYAKTNIVNLLIWGLWWPVMVWVAVLFGRIWCAICPLELVSNGAERLARRLGIKQRPLGRWLRSGALIVVGYALIQFLVAGIHLHRSPHATSLFLWVLLAITVATGLVLRDRAFCRGFCPVGLLLGTYGRGSMLAVRPNSPSVCEACQTKDCVAAANRHRLDARSCPSLLNPARLNSNADCLVCGQCFKACQPQDNMGLYLRPPFSWTDAREAVASWPVTLFVMLVSGFVAYELCSEWTAAKAVFLWVPQQVNDVLGLGGHAGGWVTGAWRLVIFPLIFWSLLGAVVQAAGGAASLREAWRRLALPLAVVVSAGHMAKGLAKVTSWGGYLPLAWNEPGGVEHARAIASGSLSAPPHLLPMIAVSMASCGLVVIMGGFALRESRLADASTHQSRVIPIAAVTLLSLFLVSGWAFQG
ncbi:MAG: 4Fe-4S binding protein [Planctomycetes bacterium]|nr:4Fe-4S binding protein [Planctomycetota bacterium]